MTDFSFNETLEMQKSLQEKYKDKWESICPETARNKMLWMIGEIGELIDIIKQNGGNKTASDLQTRAHFVEEMADVLMYYNDIMLCLEITPEELKQSYTEKYEKNMKRW